MAMTNLEGAEESCLKDVSRITAMHKYHPTALRVHLGTCLEVMMEVPKLDTNKKMVRYTSYYKALWNVRLKKKSNMGEMWKISTKF